MSHTARVRLGLYGMTVGLACGWAAWLLILNHSNMAPVFIVLLVVIGGSGVALALRPVFGPLFAGLPVLGPLFRLPVLGVRRTYIVDPNLGGRGLMFVAVAAAVVTLAGAVLVHRAAPILSGEEGGSPL
jgi:hypothetical protein